MKTLHELIYAHRREPPSLSDFPREVGDRVRLQRLAFSWCQAELAERADVSAETIKSMEEGGHIAIEDLYRVLLTLGHGVDFLRMLESPHFPTLRAHERYLELKSASEIVPEPK